MRLGTDTNILLRFANTADPRHTLVWNAVAALISRGDEVCYTPQVMREF